MSNKTNHKIIKQSHITVVPSNQMPDYQNDPFFIAMTERARARLKEIGLPEGWGRKKVEQKRP